MNNPQTVAYPVASNWIPITYTLDPMVLPGGILGAPVQRRVQLDEQAWFILTHLRGFSDIAANWLTNLKRNRSELFSSQSMHNRALWGNNLFPYRLGFPIVVAPGATLDAECQNLAAGINTLSLAFHGISVYGTKDEVYNIVARLTDGTLSPYPLEFYAYVLRGIYLPGQAAPLTEVITGEFDFVATEINGNADAPMSARLSLVGSEQGAFDDNFVVGQNMLGAGTNPNYIQPRLIGHANTIRADVRNLLLIPPNNTVEIDIVGMRFPVSGDVNRRK